MPDRYKILFQALEKKGEGAFIPFTVLGDPDPDTSFALIGEMIKAGADALELGFPFSDPIADGPTIQKAALRAFEAGVKVGDCFEIIAKTRSAFPEIPIGLLVYANLIEGRGKSRFFGLAREAGVDSILIPDVPVSEIASFRKEARNAGIKTVLILPLDTDAPTRQKIAKESEGYLYLLSRRGVTGTEASAGFPQKPLIEALSSLGSAPPVLGFGISTPEDVTRALESGCKGAISGSAVVSLIEEIRNLEIPEKDLGKFIEKMKGATRPV